MMSRLIDDLRNEIGSGRAMFVVGSGISRGATNNAQAARWDGLIQLGVDRCLALQQIDAARATQLSTRLSGSAPIEDLISVAEVVTQKLREARQGEYGLWLKETVGSLTAVNTSVLREIERLGVDVATTNYDSLIEDNTRVKKFVTWPNIGTFIRTLRKQESAVLHLHGHWSEPGSVVLGFQSYEDLLRNNAAQATARSLPMLRTLVFVGCGDGLRDPNFKRLIDWYQDVLQLAEHRHYRLVTNRDLDKGRVSQGVYDVSFGEEYSELPMFLSSLRAPRPIVIDEKARDHLTIHLDQWADLLLRDPIINKIAEGNIAAARAHSAFLAVVAAADKNAGGARVEAVSVRHGFRVTPTDFKDFLLDLMCVLVINPRNSGYLKGVIKKAVETVGVTGTSPSFLHEVLDRLVGRHIAEQSELRDAHVAQQLIERTIETFGGKDADGLYRFVQYVAFFEPAIDRNCLAAIQRTLIEHSVALSTDASASRAYMTAVRTLIGKIAWEMRVDTMPLAIPPTVPVQNAVSLGYKIDTLQTPITNMQWHEVTGRHFDESARRPSHPFVFEMIGPKGVELYESLASELEVLVTSFMQVESDESFQWDVPTAAEWLALAGCEVNPYPWGMTAPTPDHANLRYGNQKTTLQAVGLYPKGNSPSGAADCCGNVHEIVRVAFANTFPSAFRLAGGCYQNPPTSCSLLRPFKRQGDKEETRRNVGVRLIRYRKCDYPSRSRALASYLEKAT